MSFIRHSLSNTYPIVSPYSHDKESVDRHSGYGGESIYPLQCCPLVVDPLTVAAIVGLIGFGTFFLNTLITMNIMTVVPRRKRSDVISWGQKVLTWIHVGKRKLVVFKVK